MGLHTFYHSTTRQRGKRGPNLTFLYLELLYALQRVKLMHVPNSDLSLLIVDMKENKFCCQYATGRKFKPQFHFCSYILVPSVAWKLLLRQWKRNSLAVGMHIS